MCDPWFFITSMEVVCCDVPEDGSPCKGTIQFSSSATYENSAKNTTVGGVNYGGKLEKQLSFSKSESFSTEIVEGADLSTNPGRIRWVEFLFKEYTAEGLIIHWDCKGKTAEWWICKKWETSLVYHGKECSQ